MTAPEKTAIAAVQDGTLAQAILELAAERDQLRAQVQQMRSALEANHKWHQDYDDYGGYPGSDLCEMNTKALATDRG